MFVDDADFQQDFATSQGDITLFAEVHIFEGHLVLDELLFYPTRSSATLNIGTGVVLEVLRALRNLAAEQGFTELTVAFHRTGPGRHGRTITVTRRLI